MNCHICGTPDASIHLLEVINGEKTSVWLCSICAADRHDLQVDDHLHTVFGGAVRSQGESASLASFLGQVNEADKGAELVAACPDCGYELQQFQDSNLLGCAACYSHFQNQLRPILTRFHRHASHLGKIPKQAGIAATQQGVLTRLLVNLEKAIQGEDYEEAARLRDTMRGLKEKQESDVQPGDGEGQTP